MIYCDLHCDSVTAAYAKGESLFSFGGQAGVAKLVKGGCAAQCFAIFTEGENAAADFEKFAAFYNEQLAVNTGILPVERACDLEKALRKEAFGAVLTVENCGFLQDGKDGVKKFSALNVKMASLVWNTPNRFALPNLIFKGGLPDFSARENGGLTALGKIAVEALNGERIIIDLSHLSDGGAEDVLSISEQPVVASHSNAYAVCPVSRNLTDCLLKKIADKGGVVGLNFCRDFVGEGDVFENLYRHYEHMVRIGGEDLPSLGSDFDGIPVYEELSDCTKVQSLLGYFSDRGVKPRALEKLAYGNFLRVFRDVVG